MKGFFFAGVALGALVGVASTIDGQLGSNEQSSQPLNQLSALLDNIGQIQWQDYSPAALGINLNFDEMSQDQLRKVAEGFKNLGLIAPEEVEQFMAVLQDPQMRYAMKKMTEQWPETIQGLLNDPKFIDFVEKFGNREDLVKIVGLDTSKIDQAVDDAE